MKKTISNPINVAQYYYEDKNGKVKMTKPNSALSLLIKKHAWIKDRSRVGIFLLEGLILSKALSSLENTGQITDFYNELCKISRNFKYRWQLHNEILKMISSTPNTKREWRTFMERKRNYM